MSNWKHINCIYVYDNSFYGLLSVIFECFNTKSIPLNITIHETNNFLNKYVIIPTNELNAKRVYNGILNNISFSCLRFIYNTFLSNSNQKELSILHYLIIGFEIGPKVDNLLCEKCVRDVQQTSKRVFGEAHRLSGLLRFMEIGDNTFYSKIHPDNNVIEILGNHFIKRFPLQNFIIHDKNRNLAFLYNTKNYIIIDASDIQIVTTKEETFYQNLWKTFYNSISIKERTNARLQMQYMPKKYWQDLIEKP